MKVVINGCYGGFSLSPAAVRRMAELNGRECYFFTGFREMIPATQASLSGHSFFTAFDIPNPNEVLGVARPGDDETYKDYNALHSLHQLETRPCDRSDPILVQVVEELGAKANGSCADLRIVEIPDGVQYEIDDYDGIESIHEIHRSWS